MSKVLVCLAVILVLSGCSNNQGTGNYYEVVHERANCDPYCSLEYLLVSNGYILKKESHSRGSVQHDITIVKISSSKAEQAIASTHNLITEHKTERCVNCNEFTFFTLKEGQPFMHVTSEENSPDEMKTIFETTKELFEEGTEAESFFVQFVYKKIAQNSIDYHLFPNGTIVKLEFIGNSYDLGAAEVYDLETEQIEEIRNLIQPEYFSSESSLHECLTKGLEYGYLEIQKDDQYHFVWTCGTENSEADKLFNDLFEVFS